MRDWISSEVALPTHDQIVKVRLRDGKELDARRLGSNAWVLGAIDEDGDPLIYGLDDITHWREVNFSNELTSLLNRYSMENGSDTPDYILADYLMGCLAQWNISVMLREKWYGRKVTEPARIIPLTQTEQRFILRLRGLENPKRRRAECRRRELNYSWAKWPLVGAYGFGVSGFSTTTQDGRSS